MIDALSLRAGGGFIPEFSDDAGISDWARESVYKCFRYGIMMGTDNGFEPQGTYTVEQAIATMIRLYN